MGISGFCVFLYINFLLLDKRPADADEEQKPKKKVGATARFLAENTADNQNLQSDCANTEDISTDKKKESQQSKPHRNLIETIRNNVAHA